MAYLTCPSCGITLFDRNPLAAPGRCPRCMARGRGRVDFKRVARRSAAASLLGPSAQGAGGASAAGTVARQAGI